jgi:hypothetical protein
MNTLRSDRKMDDFAIIQLSTPGSRAQRGTVPQHHQ